MKLIVILFLSSLGFNAFSQIGVLEADSLREIEGQAVQVYTKDYLKKYNRLKRMVVKVYPYALYAADVVDEIDENAEQINRRRKKNAFYRESYKSLKDDFKYFILELYTSEGQMLMKLIHRETGMTVYDISNKYRGRQKANMFNLMAKIWDQNLHVQFDPEAGDDKITEQVITDIQTGLVPFDAEIITIDKMTYLQKQKEAKELRKKGKKRRKDYKKKRAKRERALKKAERKKKRK